MREVGPGPAWTWCDAPPVSLAKVALRATIGSLPCATGRATGWSHRAILCRAAGPGLHGHRAIETPHRGRRHRSEGRTMAEAEGLRGRLPLWTGALRDDDRPAPGHRLQLLDLRQARPVADLRARRSSSSWCSGLDDLVDYRFNKHVIHHVFCRTCGVESFARGKTRTARTCSPSTCAASTASTSPSSAQARSTARICRPARLSLRQR